MYEYIHIYILYICINAYMHEKLVDRICDHFGDLSDI